MADVCLWPHGLRDCLDRLLTGYSVSLPLSPDGRGCSVSAPPVALLLDLESKNETKAVAFLQKTHSCPFEIPQEQCPSVYYLLLFFYFSVPWSQHRDCRILCQLRTPAFLQRTGIFYSLVEFYATSYVLRHGFQVFWGEHFRCVTWFFHPNPTDCLLLKLYMKKFEALCWRNFLCVCNSNKYVSSSLKQHCYSNVLNLPLLSSLQLYYTSVQDFPVNMMIWTTQSSLFIKAKKKKKILLFLWSRYGLVVSNEEFLLKSITV